MADRFLRKVRDMHQLRQDIRSLLPAKAEEFIRIAPRSIRALAILYYDVE